MLTATIVLHQGDRRRFCKYHNIVNTERAQGIFWKFAQTLAAKLSMELHHINYYDQDTGQYINQARLQM